MPYSNGPYTKALAGLVAFPGLLELFSIVLGVKPNALLCLSERNIRALDSYCSLHGLSFFVSDRLWKPLNTEVEYVNACIEVSTSNSQLERNALRYVFVSVDDYELDAYRKFDNESTIDHYKLGKLLHYPECCINFFTSNWELALDLHDGDLTPLLVKTAPLNCQFSKWANYFLDYLGLPIISHFPCSLDCKATIRQTKSMMFTLSQAMPELASHLNNMLNWPVLYSPQYGLAFVTQWKQRESTEVSCSSAVFPYDSRWEPILKEFNNIQHMDLREIGLWDAEGNSMKILDGRLLRWS